MNHKNENEEGSGGQRHEQGYEYGTKIDLLFVFLILNPHNNGANNSRNAHRCR